MAKQDTYTAAEEMQTLFDPRGYQEIFRTWASYNERVTSSVLNAASKSSEVANDTAQEAFSNLREATAVKQDTAEYMQVYSTLAQKQMDLFMRTARSLGEISQSTGREAAELASEAGQDVGDTASSKAEEAADRTKSAAKKAS